jgi:hypothetical protein
VAQPDGAMEAAINNIANRETVCRVILMIAKRPSHLLANSQ